MYATVVWRRAQILLSTLAAARPQWLVGNYIWPNACSYVPRVNGQSSKIKTVSNSSVFFCDPHLSTECSFVYNVRNCKNDSFSLTIHSRQVLVWTGPLTVHEHIWPWECVIWALGALNSFMLCFGRAAESRHSDAVCCRCWLMFALLAADIDIMACQCVACMAWSGVGVNTRFRQATEFTNYISTVCIRWVVIFQGVGLE